MPRRQRPSRALSPFSTERLVRYDGRSLKAKFAVDLEAQLASDLGGDPTTAQRMLIQMAVFKAVRMAQLAEGYDSATPADAKDLDERIAKFTNSLRADLLALGLGRLARTPEDLAGYIAGRAET